MASNSYSITTTALDIIVPEVEHFVAPYRLKHCPSAQGGMPSHITLLYPFVQPDAVSEGLLQDLRVYFGGINQFDYELSEIGFFPKAVYLCPHPVAPFVEMIAGLMSKFPDCKPYGTNFKDPPPPHLTFGQAETKDELQRIATGFLEETREFTPKKARAVEAWLTVIENGISTPTVCFKFAEP